MGTSKILSHRPWLPSLLPGVNRYPSVRYSRETRPFSSVNILQPLNKKNELSCTATTGRMRSGPGQGFNSTQFGLSWERSKAKKLFMAFLAFGCCCPPATYIVVFNNAAEVLEHGFGRAGKATRSILPSTQANKNTSENRSFHPLIWQPHPNSFDRRHLPRYKSHLQKC